MPVPGDSPTESLPSTGAEPTCAGRIVVEARGESCSGCHMSIPPRFFVTVKKNDSIVGCPNCHRILYYKETITPQVP